MRDQLLRAVMARLDRIKAARDPALVLEPGALDDAQRLAEALRDDDGDLEACYVLGWFHWYRCLVLPQGRHYEALEEASRALTPCFIAGVEGLPEPLLSSLASNATGTAVTLLKQAMSGSDLNLITTTVSLWQRVLTAIPADHPDRVAMLSNLGLALQLRFERVGALADLDEAITVGRAAAQTAPADHPDRAGYLSNLSGALRVRFGRVGMLADLDEAITVARAAVRAAPADHPDQAATLSNLGGALQARFGRVGALADLDEAVTVIREAVQATLADHPTGRPRCPIWASYCGSGLGGWGRRPTWMRRSPWVGRRCRMLRLITPSRPCACPTWVSPCGPGSSGWGRRPTWMRRSPWVGGRCRMLRLITPTGRGTCPTWVPRCRSGLGG